MEFLLPELGENISSGDVVRVFVKVGDAVKAQQPVVEVETDKAAIEVPSTATGVVSQVLVKPGDKVRPGQAILKFSSSTPSVPVSSPTPAPIQTAPKTVLPVVAPPPAPAAASKAAEAAPAAPSVRKFAREIGVDISSVSGSGPAGRISMEDVKAYARLRASAPSPAAGPAAKALPDLSAWGPVERKPISGVKAATARQMSLSWTTVPHVTQHDRCDVTDFEAWRKKASEETGLKITITALLLKVAAAALGKFPQFNTSFDELKGEIVFKKYRNIGVAVDTERGLLVPVIRDADKKTLPQLAKELGEISAKARDKKITADEMKGGCFTITNLGGIGGTGFTPIVNWPEAAILGVSRSSIEPVLAPGGVFVPRTIMPLSLSYDHRLIDGADAARFLRWICETVSQPLNLSLENPS